MSDSITFTLALRTVSEANRRGSWRAHHARTKSQRAIACGVTISETRGRQWVRTERIVVTLTRIAPRELDTDNLASSAKGLRDGIADAINYGNDRDKRVTWVYAQTKGKPREYRVDVRIARAGT